MTTHPLTSKSNTSNNSSSSSSSSGSSAGGVNSLKPSDFISMMVTQLQNQDPLQPASNDQLLSEMSQIGQLQSSTQLQSSITGLAQQTQIGAAASLIGKTVSGLDSNNAPIGGIVNSVQVASGNVSLQLDNGTALDLSKVTSIAPTQTAAATTTAATTGTTTTMHA